MAVVTRYVDTASSGGDGTTQGHSGANAAYASLSAWEAAEQTNLVTDGDSHEVYLAGGADTTSCTIAGWTMGASNTLLVSGDSSAPDGDGVNSTGIFATSFYYLDNDAGNATQLSCNETYVTFQDFQGRYSTASGANDLIISLAGTADNNTVRRLILYNTDSGSTSNIALGTNNSNNVTIEACSIRGSGDSEGIRMDNSDTTGVLIQNCTIEGFRYGVRAMNDITDATLRNCAVFNNTDDVFDQTAGNLTVDYCATDDGDGTNAQDMGGSATLWDKQVIDYTTGDYNVKDTDSVLHNTGTSTGQPSADVTGTSYTTDDIGAFASAGTAPTAKGGLPPFVQTRRLLRRRRRR